MTLRLLGKEMRLTAGSLTYWLIVGIIGLFIVTQLGMDLTMIREPKKTDESYGVTKTNDKQLIQQQTYGTLYLEAHSESYSTYPLGFFKGVQLNEEEQEEIQSILEAASGLSMAELEKEYSEQMTQKMAGSSENSMNTADYEFPLKETASYQLFEQDMVQVVKLLGQGSSYEKESYLRAATEPKTYEQAIKEYRQIAEKDRVTGAYARIVCDYFGIILGIVPVFLGATVILRDRRGQAEQVIYSRSIASLRLIASRFISTALLLLIPVLLISLLPGIQSLVIAGKLGINGDLILFYQYILAWLLPTILFVTGMSFFITELFGGIAAIAVQILFWLLSIFSGSSSGNLTGEVGWNLIPRFNKVGERAVFDGIFEELVRNRLFFAGMGILLFLLTVIVYDYKRKGGRLFGKGS